VGIRVGVVTRLALAMHNPMTAMCAIFVIRLVIGRGIVRQSSQMVVRRHHEGVAAEIIEAAIEAIEAAIEAAMVVEVVIHVVEAIEAVTEVEVKHKLAGVNVFGLILMHVIVAGKRIILRGIVALRLM